MITKDKGRTCLTSFTCARRKNTTSVLLRIRVTKATSAGKSADCPTRRKMSFCGWFGGEVYKDHFENGELR